MRCAPKVLFCFVLVLLSWSLAARDIDGDGVITYLVPVYVPEAVAGAHGTLWVSELWLHNGNAHRVYIGDCEDLIGPPPACAYEPGVTRLSYPHFPARAAELLVHVAVEDAERLVFSSRLFELSRLSQPVGIEVPVVGEERFFTKPVRFIAVPSSPALRVALRVYDPRRSMNGIVRVELVESASGQQLAEASVPIVYSDESSAPGLAMLGDLASLFPEVRSVDRYDVRVLPLGAEMEYWAIISVTDNDTQQVFTITTDR
jgi:hypothetical protein